MRSDEPGGCGCGVFVGKCDRAKLPRCGCGCCCSCCCGCGNCREVRSDEQDGAVRYGAGAGAVAVAVGGIVRKCDRDEPHPPPSPA